jgi:hypothetical protein
VNAATTLHELGVREAPAATLTSVLTDPDPYIDEWIREGAAERLAELDEPVAIAAE